MYLQLNNLQLHPMKPSERVSRQAKVRIGIVEISGRERDRLLTLDEDHFCDLKSTEVSPSKLTRTVSAFANASGGDLYVGIGETEFFGTKTRLWSGFKDAEAANAHLQVLAKMFPLGSEYSYEFLRSAGSIGSALDWTKVFKVLSAIPSMWRL